MEVVLTAVQFVASCLVLGLGLYFAPGAAQQLYRRRIAALPAAATTAVLVGALILLSAGTYAAFLALPL